MRQRIEKIWEAIWIELHFLFLSLADDTKDSFN